MLELLVSISNSLHGFLVINGSSFSLATTLSSLSCLTGSTRAKGTSSYLRACTAG